LCSPGDPPRVAGSLPGSGRGTFTALDLRVSDDLRAVDLSDMKMVFGASTVVRVHAKEAHITGMSPWGRASNLRPSSRALLLSLTGAGLALFVALIVLRGGHSSRVVALTMGGAGPAAALTVFSLLERRATAPWAYVAVPVAAVAAVVIAAGLFGGLRRLVPSWRRSA
jgi:hypothetical protein